MHVVAVMQPYFIPYAGYFRLFAAADQFVIYDCVQFPRRGFVHRNRLPDALGRPRWLTLPLRSMPRDTCIRDLAFRAGSGSDLRRAVRRFPRLERNREHPLVHRLLDVDGTPVEYLEGLLALCCELLDLPFATVRSSDLGIPSSVRGQDRIIAIARACNATHYVNPPGGRQLYDPGVFRAAGLGLRFLNEYAGPSWSIVHRLLDEPTRRVRAEIEAQSHAGTISC